MSRRQKTPEEIRAKIQKLQAALDEQERAERVKIGAELQKLTGKTTWAEIKPLIEIKGGSQDAV